MGPKVRILAAAAMMALPLAGCVDRSTSLQNSQGQAVRCHAFGFGILGSIMAASEQRNCVDSYHAAGYAEPGATPHAQHTEVVPETGLTPSAITSKDGRIRLTLPAGWFQADAPKPLSNVQMFARNPSFGGTLFVSLDEKTDIQDLEVYGRTLQRLLANKLSETELSKVQRTAVNGHPAVRFDVGGVTNGVRIHYLMTVVDGKSTVLKLNAWTVESKFIEHRDELAALAAGLTEISTTVDAK
jgi:hypothetical protein